MIAAAALTAAAIAAVLVSRRVAGDPVAPPAVVVAAWCGTLALFALHRLPYLAPDARTWTILAASIAVLVVTLTAGTLLTRTSPRPALPPRALSSARAWIPVYAALGLLGMAWYVWNIQHILGWSAFRNGARIRLALGSYTIPSTFLFLQFFCVVTPLVALTVRLAGARLRAIDLGGASLCVVATWLSTDRTQFFTLAATSCFLALYVKGPSLSIRRLVTAVLAAALLLGINFAMIARWVGKSPQASAYVYATASYPAFHVALQSPPAGTHGLHTFYPVARLLERLHVIDGPLPSPIFDYTTVTRGRPEGELLFNGYTWLNYPYQDWGVAGVFPYVAAIGLAGGVLYARVRANRVRPVALLLMAQFATGLLLSPFVNKFNNTASWYIAVFSVLPFVVASWRPSRTA